ncbi:MAG: site-specific DNA-methyltransferase [Butyrivibrio sp.]|uniref:site-specific DNA-methyltransferase n=1 Tax=Butyrivibrio sp. TaxID=28121 RepID=UPI001ED67930|nr:DNA methyltransferase [Butyrivibrio sp.]MBE5841427.1 site-specific DNA-methyltransferase [Butyrivibrio sp.]
MAAIHELLSRVEDEELRTKLEEEFNKLSKQKKFGLVFEEHLPECTPLFDMPIKRGSVVAKKAGAVSEMLDVLAVKDGIAACVHQVSKEKEEIPVEDLVCVAQFGEPIYPYLKPIDSVCNAPDSDLWHTLIEADNYHALQLLEYLYPGKVDCIYIDPPYNTGARDWKYNNDYVDSADSYRHSKWLSMMEKRLKLAKKLLNPKDSVLIVTIDEKEYLHLGCLLEEMFPEGNVQMVTDVINAKGVARLNQFSRVEEYIFFVQLGNSMPISTSDSMLDFEVTGNYRQNVGDTIPWARMLRRGSNSHREHSENCFYPIFVNESEETIVSVGNPPGKGNDRNETIVPDGCIAIWPMHADGVEGCWQLSRPKFLNALQEGTAKLGRKNKLGQWSINYLNQGILNEIQNGSICITGNDEKGAVILERKEDKLLSAKSVWNRKSHDASLYGSVLLSSIVGKRFSYPKSVYSEKDTIRFFTKNKPNALIVDFFAGSGTTLHAVNLLNAEDGGHRRCIMVTNNEVSDAEAKNLTKSGYKPGDAEWESLGIARYVTWPRTVCSIEGHDVNGNPLKGNYLGSDIPMSDGFKANAAYFKLGFLDKTSVSLGRQLIELLPVLWMKAGAHGVCPNLKDTDLSDYWICIDNKMAILINTACYPEFENIVKKERAIETVYIITDYEAEYRTMRNNLNVANTYQLYRDYLDNFRINQGR